MCTTCGCGDTELVPVELHEKILAGNDRTAAHNRAHFRESGVLALNIMGSPGSGKTAVLEATARVMKGVRLGAVSADLATDNDAQRLSKAGHPVEGDHHGPGVPPRRRAGPPLAARLPLARARRVLHRERGEPRLPGHLRPGPGGERGRALRHRGRGQAAQVPGHVPEGRPRARDEGGPRPAPRLRPGAAGGQPAPRHAGSQDLAGVGPHRRGDGGVESVDSSRCALLS